MLTLTYCPSSLKPFLPVSAHLLPKLRTGFLVLRVSWSVLQLGQEHSGCQQTLMDKKKDQYENLKKWITFQLPPQSRSQMLPSSPPRNPPALRFWHLPWTPGDQSSPPVQHRQWPGRTSQRGEKSSSSWQRWRRLTEQMRRGRKIKHTLIFNSKRPCHDMMLVKTATCVFHVHVYYVQIWHCIKN